MEEGGRERGRKEVVVVVVGSVEEIKSIETEVEAGV